MSLLTIIPTRGRPEKVTALIKSFNDKTDGADLLFVIDPDDPSMEDFDFQGHSAMVLDPRGSMVQKLNYAAGKFLDDYDRMVWYADDNEFVTDHWDTLMEKTLDEMGGSGWVYSYDHRRTDIPETWMVSTDVVRELGWFANPALNMYYVADSINVLARRSSLLRFCRDVEVVHHHYDVDPEAKRDAVNEFSESTFGKVDYMTYQAWVASNQVAVLVSRLRRKFNPDIQWILGKV